MSSRLPINEKVLRWLSLLLVFKFSTEVLSMLLLFGFRIIDRWFECSIFAYKHDHGSKNLTIIFLSGFLEET